MANELHTDERPDMQPSTDAAIEQAEREHTSRSARMVDALQGAMIANLCGELANKIADKPLPDQQWSHVITTLREQGLSVDVLIAKSVDADELAKLVRPIDEHTRALALPKKSAAIWWDVVIGQLDLAGFRITRKGV